MEKIAGVDKLAIKKKDGSCDVSCDLYSWIFHNNKIEEI